MSDRPCTRRCTMARVGAASLLMVVALATATLAARQLASRTTEDWIKTLEAPERIASLKVNEVVSGLKLAPGQSVADLGAGAGTFEVALARAVGPNGTIYAVEIDRGLADYISKKVSDAKVQNVQVLVSKPEDPGLPVTNLDLAF